MSLDGEVGPAASCLWSLLIQCDENWRGDGISNAKVDPSIFENVVEEMTTPQPEEAVVKSKAGRPRISDDRVHGNVIVEFVRNFLASRGQTSAGSNHRLTTSTTVISASLDIMRKAALKANLPVSRTGIYNLLAPPQKNSTSSNQRGEID